MCIAKIHKKTMWRDFFCRLLLYSMFLGWLGTRKVWLQSGILFLFNFLILFKILFNRLLSCLVWNLVQSCSVLFGVVWSCWSCLVLFGFCWACLVLLVLFGLVGLVWSLLVVFILVYLCLILFTIVFNLV